jgi:drug/metabolite transporter (DMT)-like permease
MALRHAVLLVATAFWWGAAYVFAALALEGFNPVTVVALRLVLAAAALAVVLAVSGDGALRAAMGVVRRRPAASILLAITAAAGPFTLITSGQRHVPAGTTGVLIATVPLWTAVLGIWLDRSERLGRRQALGLLTGLVGVGLVVGFEAVHTTAQLIGAGLILLGAGCVAVGNFVSKRQFAEVPAPARALLTTALAAVVLTPGAVATADVELSARSVIGLLGLGLGSTALLLVLTFALIDAVGPRRGALSAYLAPAFALVLAAIVLGDPISPAAVSGLVLIVGGVVLASRTEVKPPAADTPVTPSRGERTDALRRHDPVDQAR